MAPDMKGISNGFALYTRVKRNDLKWYQKLWNIVSGNKERNWKWILVNEGGIE